MNNSIPSISESFNAKTTTTQELCNSFIPNDFFNKLACPNHCIMIGPRGSGKTTLMRMLEVESLELWDGPSADEYRKDIGFSGVFIPTDRYWKTQYNKIERRRTEDGSYVGDNSPLDQSLMLLDNMFTYHVLEQFISSINYRASKTVKKINNFRSIDISKTDEVELVKYLAALWNVKPILNTFRGLYSSLVLKKRDISNLVNMLINGRVESQIIDDKIELINVLDASVSIANSFFGENNGKWAFLFDELELAPNEIIQPLVDQMRGGHKDIIFKLALSPYHQGVSITGNPDSSMKSEDLKYINLTGLGDKEGYKFSKQLCTSLFLRKGLFQNVESYFSEPSKIDTNRDFKALVDKDRSFRGYLSKRGLLKDEYDDSDSLIRKIKFIVHLRNHKKDDNDNVKRRRRPSDYYGGFAHICKSVEYNPRMLIGLMNNFIPIAKEEKISIATQMKCLSSYFDSFRSLLGTIALDSNDSDFNNIYDFIEEIANYFSSEIYGGKFKAEPKGCFKIINGRSKGYQDIVGFALNAGALVIVDGEDTYANNLGVDASKTCRLSYIFSHHFGLLMTKQKDMSLDDLVEATKLRASGINVIRNIFDDFRQYPLELSF